MNKVLVANKFRTKKLDSEELILLFLFFASIIWFGMLKSQSNVFLLYFFAYIIPISSFGNNLSNIPFLIFWGFGIFLMYLFFEKSFYIGPLKTTILYLFAKLLFVFLYKKDLILGSFTGRIDTGRWYSGISKSDLSKSDKRDMRFHIAIVFIAILNLFVFKG